MIELTYDYSILFFYLIGLGFLGKIWGGIKGAVSGIMGGAKNNNTTLYITTDGMALKSGAISVDTRRTTGNIEDIPFYGPYTLAQEAEIARRRKLGLPTVGKITTADIEALGSFNLSKWIMPAVIIGAGFFVLSVVSGRKS